MITARLQKSSKLSVTNFYAGKGVQLTGDATREGERITTAFGGTTAREELKPLSRGSPVYTAAGWYDYQGQRASMGMAYLNSQGMMLLFDLVPQGAGIQLSWRTFNLKGFWNF